MVCGVQDGQGANPVYWFDPPHSSENHHGDYPRATLDSDVQDIVEKSFELDVLQCRDSSEEVLEFVRSADAQAKGLYSSGYGLQPEAVDRIDSPMQWEQSSCPATKCVDGIDFVLPQNEEFDDEQQKPFSHENSSQGSPHTKRSKIVRR
jgi:hypothetical protein